jgi:hypothetical protein
MISASFSSFSPKTLSTSFFLLEQVPAQKALGFLLAKWYKS